MKRAYSNISQQRNLAWFLPRPKPDRYKGGMPLHCEKWLIELAEDILKKRNLSILNLFCGMNVYGLRVDIRPEVKPDVLCDAHECSSFINKKFDLIIADPPYSIKEAKKLYGTPRLKYKKWTRECDKLLKTGGILIIYHKHVMPNPNPEKYYVVKRVFIGNRSHHIPRVALYFVKRKLIKRMGIKRFLKKHKD